MLQTDFIYKFRWQILLLLLGCIFVAFGILHTKSQVSSSPSIEIVEDKVNGNDEGSSGKIFVEVSGKVKNAGVYTFSEGARIDDAINAAGGLSEDADLQYVTRFLNRAAKLVDGQKIYIPSTSEQSSTKTATELAPDQNVSSDILGATDKIVNVNTASSSELESLRGIGPVTAQKIIEQRPYSTVQELVEKKIIKQNVYDKNANLLSVY